MMLEGFVEWVKEEVVEFIDFIWNLLFYYEEGKYVFVYVGVDLMKKDWYDIEECDFFWICEFFLFG